jgi:hypothetical protein
MTETPLESWLKAHDIPVEKAAGICRRRHCIGGFRTLMQHPFTLPKLAYEVALALGIPAKDAAKMGKYIDKADWDRHGGVERLDTINHDPKWVERIGGEEHGEAPIWLDIVAVRNILAGRGVDWYAWEKEHKKLYARCRSFCSQTKYRLKAIHELAALIDVPVEKILTNQARVHDRQREHFWTYLSTYNHEDQLSMWCKIDGDKVKKMLDEQPKTLHEQAELYCTTFPGGTQSPKKQVDTFRSAVANLGYRYKTISSWQTAQKFAHVLGCDPEDICHRYTKGEHRHMAMKSALDAQERREQEEYGE